MRVTKKIKMIVGKANAALYYSCLSELAARDHENTDERRLAAVHSSDCRREYRLGLLDALRILGFDTDKDVGLDDYFTVMEKATKDYKQKRSK